MEIKNGGKSKMSAMGLADALFSLSAMSPMEPPETTESATKVEGHGGDSQLIQEREWKRRRRGK